MDEMYMKWRSGLDAIVERRGGDDASFSIHSFILLGGGGGEDREGTASKILKKNDKENDLQKFIPAPAPHVS